MRKLTKEQINELEKQAQTLERKRSNIVLHPAEYAGCRAMINTFHPDSYACPHIHSDKDEIFIHLKGKLAMILFEDSGKIKEIVVLSDDNVKLVEIPANTPHSILSLNGVSTVCEISMGPHNLETYKKFADFAPKENEPEAQEYFKNLVKEVEKILEKQ